MRHTGGLLVLVLLMSGATAPDVWSRQTSQAAPLSTELRHALVQSLDRGLAYLRQEQQPDGSLQHHPGLTALAATGFLLYPGGLPAQHAEAVDKALAYIVSLAKPDGGIYERDNSNYNTSVAIMALLASGKPEYRPLIDKAQQFLLKLQIDEEEGYTPSHKFYGGLGYGDDLRPDLPNLEFALQALKASGVPSDRAVWSKAITFLQRSQNRSESNDQSWAGNDGGFVYYPGFSSAGGTTSYGSMTLAGVLSFSYASVDKNDPRVQDALRWIRQHYTVDENPGWGNKVLFYYYQLFAKAMYVYEEPIIVDAAGMPHNWRQDLGHKLLGLQYPEGYWMGDDPAEWNNNKVLATSFAAIALNYVLSPQGAITW